MGKPDKLPMGMDESDVSRPLLPHPVTDTRNANLLALGMVMGSESNRLKCNE
jgi:hypothetical protein